MLEYEGFDVDLEADCHLALQVQVQPIFRLYKYESKRFDLLSCK